MIDTGSETLNCRAMYLMDNLVQQCMIGCLLRAMVLLYHMFRKQYLNHYSLYMVLYNPNIYFELRNYQDTFRRDKLQLHKYDYSQQVVLLLNRM